MSEWLIGGHRISDSPPRPIGLLGAILAAYTAHNELSVRPTAYAEAEAATEAAERAEQARRREAERAELARGREIGLAAMHGSGYAEFRALNEKLARKRRPWS